MLVHNVHAGDSHTIGFVVRQIEGANEAVRLVAFDESENEGKHVGEIIVAHVPVSDSVLHKQERQSLPIEPGEGLSPPCPFAPPPCPN